MLCGAGAFGQEGGAAPAFRAAVVDQAGSMQQIDVALFRSVTVETTVEIARADVVANAIADVQIITPRRLLVTGRGYGATNVVLTGADGRQYVLEVSVQLDLSKLNDAIRTVDPLSDVRVESILGNIVLSGTASSAENATRIMELAQLFLPPGGTGGQNAAVQNHLDVAGEQQVLLRCIVAEVNRAAIRDLGINGFLAGENFKDAFLVNQLGGISPINIGAAAGAAVTGNVPFVTGGDGIPIGAAPTLSLGFPRVQLQTFIRALADNTLLKVLAEPNLVAISGETATFLAGGEFPIPVPQGNQTVTIDFREFGVRLNFTPVVRGNQRIRLRVAPEVSELDFSSAAQFQGFVIPGLTSRSAETTVDLGNGETIAIAGLLSEQVRGIASRVPGVGDLPVLGTLFRSVNFRRSLSELVILVTPEIVSPLDAHQQLNLEASLAREPTDFELYALGLLEHPDQPPPPSDADPADLAVSKPIPSAPETLSVHGPWGHADPAGR